MFSVCLCVAVYGVQLQSMVFRRACSRVRQRQHSKIQNFVGGRGRSFVVGSVLWAVAPPSRQVEAAPTVYSPTSLLPLSPPSRLLHLTMATLVVVRRPFMSMSRPARAGRPGRDYYNYYGRGARHAPCPCPCTKIPIPNTYTLLSNSISVSITITSSVSIIQVQEDSKPALSLTSTTTITGAVRVRSATSGEW